MEKALKYFFVALSGGIAIFSVLLIAKPVFDVFKPISELTHVSNILVTGLILLTIGLAIFSKMVNSR